MSDPIDDGAREDLRDEAAHAAVESALRAGRPSAALEAAELWIARAPDAAEAWNLLGRARVALGDAGAAEAAFARAVALAPHHDRAACNLAKLRADAGDLEGALASLEAARAAAPESRRVLRALGVTLSRLERFEDAIAPLEAALADGAEPGLEALLVAALDEAAWSADRARRFDLAARWLERAVARSPNEPSFVRRLATALATLRRVPEALATLERSPVADDPSLRSTWLQLRHYLPGFSRADARAAHARYGDALPPPSPRSARPARAARERIRVAYFSRDLRKHAVAWFLLPILRHHDRARFEIVLLSDVRTPDEVTARLSSLVEGRVDLSGLTNEALRARVLREDLDVLVDLGGHTAFERLPALAEKLARVQLGYLGYPDRTGLPSYDGRVVDAVTDPPGADEGEREPLLRLDVCAWSFDPGCSELPTLRPARPGVVLGTYNYLGKVTDEVARAWARILARVPDARLRVKAAAYASPAIAEAHRRELGAFGVDPTRLDLVPPTETREAHLASYTELDLALDTFPYNGTTTTCEALWMGTPVVTLAGSEHAARVGTSLLEALGRPELVAPTVDAYVEVAVALARDRARLDALHRSLRVELLASPVGRGDRLTDALEALYLRMLDGAPRAPA